MKEIAPAWFLRKVTSLIVRATKFHHRKGAVRTIDFELSEEESTYLEEAYLLSHTLVGIMAQNKCIGRR